MRRVLVIGGSYFAGRVFVEELVREPDCRVEVFNRGRIPLGIPGVTEHVGDRDDESQLRRIPSAEWDAVVDFCGYEPQQVERLLSNLPGSIRHYIFISTTAIYRRSWQLPLTEDSAKLDGPQPELGSYATYGYHKWLCEQAAAEHCARSGVAFTALRPAIVFGSYNYAPRESYFFDCLRDKRPIVIPEGVPTLFSCLWVVDLARTILRCLGNPGASGRALNVASEELISHERIVEALSEITGAPINCMRLPVERIEQENLPVPFPLREHLVCSVERVRRTLGHDCTPFRAALRDTLKYYLTVQRHARAAGR